MVNYNGFKSTHRENEKLLNTRLHQFAVDIRYPYGMARLTLFVLNLFEKQTCTCILPHSPSLKRRFTPPKWQAYPHCTVRLTSHGIGPFCPEYSGISTRRLKITRHDTTYLHTEMRCYATFVAHKCQLNYNEIWAPIDVMRLPDEQQHTEINDNNPLIWHFV